MKKITLAALLLIPTAASANLSYDCNYHAAYAGSYFDSHHKGIPEEEVAGTIQMDSNFTERDKLFHLHLLNMIYDDTYPNEEISRTVAFSICQNLKQYNF
tara:strand:- start:113 stop:412 length:300 start_codon:yes stop_codon:yes gene_type:complete